MTHVPARLLDATPAQYHADPCRVPSLSSSIAHVLVTQSPLHAWYLHPRLGGGSKDGTAATDTGALIHRLLLGKGADIAIAPTEWADAKGNMVPAVEWRTHTAKEFKAAALAAGKLPLLQHEANELLGVSATLKDKLLHDFNIDLQYVDARQEQAFEWEQNGVLCRCMMDYVELESGVIIDVKTIHNAHPKTAARHFTQYGYDIQYAAYTSALAAYRPEFEGRVDMEFLFVEPEPPHAIVLAAPSGAMRDLGHRRWLAALRGWKVCTEHDVWPGYATGCVTLEPPPWQMQEMLEAGE